MKKILGTLLAVLFSFMAINDSAAQNTVLRFNKDGKFKIVQFSMYISSMVIRLRM